MTGVPLYLTDTLAPDSFEAAIMVVQIVKALIGIGIAVIAYRGYRRNDSRPMLYIAAGFVLVLGLPFVLYLAGIAVILLAGLPETAQAGILAVSELSQLLGLVAIFYALRL